MHLLLRYGWTSPQNGRCSKTAEYAISSAEEARGADTRMGSATREFMSSVNCCLDLSNSVSTGGTAVRAGTLGGAGLDFFEREELVVDGETGSRVRTEETGSMWAAVVETLGVATVADGTT